MGILSNTRIALTTAVLIVPSVTLAEIETPAPISTIGNPLSAMVTLPMATNSLFGGISTLITTADNTLASIMNKMIGTANAAATATKIVAISATSYDTTRARSPELAIDGNLTTKWTALFMPQWLILDLGSVQSISGINMQQIYVANNGANASYAIDVSSNKIGWTTVVPYTSAKASSKSIQKNFTPITGRYVRLRLSSTNYSDYINLGEIMVYAQALPGDTDGEDINNIKLTLSWKPSTGSIQGYKVFYGTTASSATAELSDIPNTLSTSFNPATPAIKYDSWYTLRLLSGDSICFKIRAYNADGLSNWSLPICGTITEAAS
jgi:hypothetical protein